MFILISKMIIKRPVQIILVALLIIVLGAAGANKIRMATGNDTLIVADSDIYQQNLALEAEFGGESIVVLFEGKETKDLLTTDNFKKMLQLENMLIQYDEIYTIVSPVTIIQQMSGKQANKFRTGIEEVADGLHTMGTKLTGIGSNINANSVKQPPLPNGEAKTAQLNNRLMQMSQGQEKLKEGAASELDMLQTSQTVQLREMQGLEDMGDKLLNISNNLGTMLTYSDALTPSIPTMQKTLDQMVYDDRGDLRGLFDELIVDGKYMLFIVKLMGNVDDTAKMEIADSIKEFIIENPMQSIETIVSGKPVLDNAIRFSMKNSMKKMMGLSVVFMIAVLLMTFRVKWRLLPLLTILIAMVGTVGVMGWLNIPVTMVSMAVFPILIGLGIDYAIQFQSRYTEEIEVK